MNRINDFGRAKIWASLSILCLMTACTSDEGSSEKEPTETPPVQVTSVADGSVGINSPEPEAKSDQASSVDTSETKDLGRDIRPASYNARDLLDELQSLSWQDNERIDEQSGHLLQRLRAQGADALIPIRDILLDDGDAESVPPELRQVLLEILLGLGLPEIEGIALELLASRPSATEVWQLGQYLDSTQPGKYTDSIRTAAEQALIETAPSVALPPEFFLFLAEMGNEETALVLAELPMYLEAYGTLALTAIPEGAGVPLLAQDARAFEAGRDTLQGRLAIQLLAQQAPRFPEAAAVLIDLAEHGAIPENLWPYVLDIVAGHWVLTMIEPPRGDVVGSHTYYHPEGDQVIYRAVQHQDGTEDELRSQRLFLLDRLQSLAPPGLWPGSN